MIDLFLVFGGSVKDGRGCAFQDVSSLDVVGMFGSRAAALEAWRSASQRCIDDAEMKYLIVDLSRSLDRSSEALATSGAA